VLFKIQQILQPNKKAIPPEKGGKTRDSPFVYVQQIYQRLLEEIKVIGTISILSPSPYSFAYIDKFSPKVHPLGFLPINFLPLKFAGFLPINFLPLLAQPKSLSFHGETLEK